LNAEISIILKATRNTSFLLRRRSPEIDIPLRPKPSRSMKTISKNHGCRIHMTPIAIGCRFQAV
jgi:hypothetical protein